MESASSEQVLDLVEKVKALYQGKYRTWQIIEELL